MKELGYCGTGLDRATALRTDILRIVELLDAPDTLFLPVRDGRNFVERTPGGALGVHVANTGTAAAVFARARPDAVFLGFADGRAVFAVDLTALAEADAAASLGTGHFIDVGDLFSELEPTDAARMAYAKAITEWSGTHRFCPNCGSPTTPEQAGHVRRCRKGACGRQHFPRLNPAIIVLVTLCVPDGAPPQCLLGRQRSFPPGMYSALAGFVEQGESFEETVVREVLEEAGVRVRDVRYVGSQPWPFPASFMIGFEAYADSAEMLPNDAELEDVRWFSIDEVRALKSGEGQASAARRLPRAQSIARHLIERWLGQHDLLARAATRERADR